jgi:membrane protease YdiL (CAAX protease family)
VLDLIILSLGFMVHMWALPYSFKNLLFDSIVRFVQLAFGVIILIFLKPSALLPGANGLLTGVGVGAACFVFQLLYSRGIRLRGRDLTGSFLASQAIILLFQVPAEEIFYRGVFFTLLAAAWGPFTGLVLSAALSTMITVVSTRKQILWLGSGLMGILCGLGYYWTQCIWAPIFIHVLNDVGFVTLNEKRDLFRR